MTFIGRLYEKRVEGRWKWKSFFSGLCVGLHEVSLKLGGVQIISFFLKNNIISKAKPFEKRVEWFFKIEVLQFLS